MQFHFPGSIITVESVRFKYRFKGMDPDIGFHSYETANSNLKIVFLRVFYAKGQPMYESIGKCDEVLSEASFNLNDKNLTWG